MNDTTLKIGALARQAGVGRRAIRLYEARGIIPPAPRAENTYRLYPPETVELLRFIKQAQRVGLALDEIKEIVSIRQGGRPPCRHVYRVLEQKSVELDRKLKDLLALRRRLRQSLKAWGRNAKKNAAVCPHLEGSRVR